MNKLKQAARQACQTPLKDLLRSVPKDGQDCYEEDSTCHHFIPYGRLIHEALAEIERLEALAEPQITTPDVCGEVCARAKLCYGCNKDLEEANAKYAEQAEQEPVAWRNKDTGSFCTGGFLCKDIDKWTPLYAAPVRTKNLTDDEIASIGSELAAKNCVSDIAFARAVIAADRAKNNLCERTK